MFLQFIGLTFFSLLMASVKDMLFRSARFTDHVEEKEESLELWISQLEEANKSGMMTLNMYYEIKHFIMDSMLNDHNMIVEVYSFFNELPPAIQHEIVDHIFGYLKGSNRRTAQAEYFFYFFNRQSSSGAYYPIEQGFANAILVNMYCRQYHKGSVILDYGENADEIFFIRSGQVDMYFKGGLIKFNTLPTFSWFADWNVIHKLRSVI